MRVLSFSFETRLRFSEPVTSHDFVLRCLPTTGVGQTVLEAQTIFDPTVHVARQVDGFGNLLQVGRIEAPHDVFEFVSSGTVLTDCDEVGRHEPCHPIYLRASQMTQPGPAIRDFVGEALRTCPGAGPVEKGLLLSAAIGRRCSYVGGVTDVDTTAEEALVLGEGVCQDFAHILVASCREAGVPARYVNGFVMGHGATHAWVEVHDGTCWRGIDPTAGGLVGDDHVVLSRGRDFADCPVESGVFLGGARQRQRVSVTVAEDGIGSEVCQ